MSIKISNLTERLPEGSGIYCPFPENEIIGVAETESLGAAYDSAFLYTGRYDRTADFGRYRNLTLLLYIDDLAAEEIKNFSGENNVLLINGRDAFLQFREKIEIELRSSRNMSEISAELLKMLQNGCSLQELLDYGHSKIGNPLMLVDVSFNFLAASGAENVNDEPVWEYTIKNGFMPNYYLNAVARENSNDDIFNIGDSASSMINHSQLVWRIIQNSGVIGYIHILESEKKLTDADMEIIRLMASFLSINLSKKLGNNFQFSVIENFLTSILRNKITNPEEIETRQELFGIKLYDYLHVITIELNDFHVSDEKKYYILTKMKKYFDKNNVVVLNNYIVVLYDTKTREEAFSDTMMTEFTALLETYDCQANISFPFDSLKDFYKYYVQTVYCVNLRELVGDDRRVIKYEDIIEYHMIISFSELVDIELMVHDAVKELIKVDEENDSDYVNTLFIYVNCQQNLSKAAEHMFLHYNTLKYRVNRIIAMTGVDLSDENVVFAIMMSEKILKLKKLIHHRKYDFNGILLQ